MSASGSLPPIRPKFYRSFGSMEAADSLYLAGSCLAAVHLPAACCQLNAECCLLNAKCALSSRRSFMGAFHLHMHAACVWHPCQLGCILARLNRQHLRPTDWLPVANWQSLAPSVGELSCRRALLSCGRAPPNCRQARGRRLATRARDWEFSACKRAEKTHKLRALSVLWPTRLQ